MIASAPEQGRKTGHGKPDMGATMTAPCRNLLSVLILMVGDKGLEPLTR